MASSPVAFVEGGAQDACEDSCSICLEPFCDSNPSTITSCKHEYHLQCIIEWSQRSKECPMCWQSLRLSDPKSQELLDAVEKERSFRHGSQIRPIFQRTPLIFHGAADEAELDFEERIMQHLAAATIGRANLLSRRENPPDRQRASLVTAQEIQQRTEPSECQSFSESWKSRLLAASSRYKETLAKTTRGLRERLRARTDITDIGARAREMSAGFVRAIEHISLESAGKSRDDISIYATDGNLSDINGCSTLTRGTRVRGVVSINCG